MRDYIPEFQHYRCSLNRYTFKVRDIRDWVVNHSRGRVLNLFAGYVILMDLDETRVDLDPDAPADYHMDAFDYLVMTSTTSTRFDTVILDPPYALRKSMEMYGGRKVSSFMKIKDQLMHVLSEDARVITLGYHSVSMGKSRGFETSAIALFSHGGAIHDTIGTVEDRIGGRE